MTQQQEQKREPKRQPKREPKRQPKREPLTRERIVAAAAGLADEAGFEAVTMRRLADRLEVKPMSLYHHIDGKADLVGGLIEWVFVQYRLPEPESSWRAAVLQIAGSSREVLVRHPWAIPLITRTDNPPGPGRLAYLESLLTAFRRSGFSQMLTHHAFHVIDSYVVGYADQQANFPLDEEDLEELGTAFLAELPADRYPYLAEHVAGHISGDFDEQSAFDVGLDLLLDGLERRREGG